MTTTSSDAAAPGLRSPFAPGGEASNGPDVRQIQACGAPRPPTAVFAWCPMCDGELIPEHAHYRCPGCGWRDSCCD